MHVLLRLKYIYNLQTNTVFKCRFVSSIRSYRNLLAGVLTLFQNEDNGKIRVPCLMEHVFHLGKIKTYSIWTNPSIGRNILLTHTRWYCRPLPIRSACHDSSTITLSCNGVAIHAKIRRSISLMYAIVDDRWKRNEFRTSACNYKKRTSIKRVHSITSKV